MDDQDNDTVQILHNIETLITDAFQVQEKLAENIIYIRDRGDRLNERVKSLESKLQIPQPQTSSNNLEEIQQLIATAVNSMNDTVRGMKQVNTVRSDCIDQIKYSLDRITSEFKILSELMLDELSETSDD